LLVAVWARVSGGFVECMVWQKSRPLAQPKERTALRPQDMQGCCERILRTPIPLSYTRHTSRFMMIWLTLLPFW
jgi:hypothetical protein